MSVTGKVRVHTSHFRWRDKDWTGGGARPTLRLKPSAQCSADKVHKTPEYRGQKLEENTYDRPLGRGGPGSMGAQGGVGVAGAGAGRSSGAAAELTTYELNSLIPRHERDRVKLIEVGPGRCCHHL